MNKWIAFIAAGLFVLTAQAAAPPEKGGYMPMPPTFSIDGDRDQILKSYPLGVITQEAAFAHHGQAHKVVALPNGLDGWVYELSPENKETYMSPSGEKRDVQSLEHTNVHSTYTLVFDSRGVVIDVLYRSPDRGEVQSALLVQRQEKPDIDKEPWRSKHRGIE